MKIFTEQYKVMLKEALELYGPKLLAQKIGVNWRTLSNWSKASQAPRADLLGAVADLMGWKLVKCGVDSDNRLEASDLVRMGNSLLSRQVNLSDYEAVPLVDDPNCLRHDSSVIPNQNILHYSIIHKSTAMLDQCSPNLVGVSVLESSIGTLIEKSDTVIFDREDREIEQGRVYLVRTPSGETLIRRVIVATDEDGNTRLTFFSENHDVPSLIFHLDAYEGDMSRAILGRGVWFRGDLRNL